MLILTTKQREALAKAGFPVHENYSVVNGKLNFTGKKPESPEEIERVQAIIAGRVSSPSEPDTSRKDSLLGPHKPKGKSSKKGD